MKNNLRTITRYINNILNKNKIQDIPSIINGLQFANNGIVTKIGAAVDGGLEIFKKAKKLNINYIIVHHGFLFKNEPITENLYKKYKILIQNNIAVYASHAPLDFHPIIGNNILLAKKLKINILKNCIFFNNQPLGLLGAFPNTNKLKVNIKNIFGSKFIAIEKGQNILKNIIICSGSGNHVFPYLKHFNSNTLITGEIKQQYFNLAEEEKLNIYLCGHYQTEIFGVTKLAQKISKQFKLPYNFIKSDCPL